MKLNKVAVRTNEAGMVAIIVTMIMIFVITLIVLGFSQVTRNNQRESLDTQLGLQAYYAAETGVNDVVKAVKGMVDNGVQPVTVTECRKANELTEYATGAGRQLITPPRVLRDDDTSDEYYDVANTCLLVDAEPTSLVVDSIVDTKQSVQWLVKNSSTKFSSLTFVWDQAAQAGTDDTCEGTRGAYPAYSAWKCNKALLRVDILDADPNLMAQAGGTDAATLAGRTTTLYLQPTNKALVSPSINTLGSPVAQQGTCDASQPTKCSVTVSMNGAAQSTQYYVRISALYRTANGVTVTGKNASDGTNAHFVGGQIVVDSTGRARDQIKRIKVRIPLTGTTSVQPVFGIQSSGTVCKAVTYTSTSYSNNCAQYWQ